MAFIVELSDKKLSIFKIRFYVTSEHLPCSDTHVKFVSRTQCYSFSYWLFFCLKNTFFGHFNDLFLVSQLLLLLVEINLTILVKIKIFPEYLSIISYSKQLRKINIYSGETLL